MTKPELDIPKMKATGKCAVKGCGGLLHRDGLCYAHRAQFANMGWTIPRRTRGPSRVEVRDNEAYITVRRGDGSSVVARIDAADVPLVKGINWTWGTHYVKGVIAGKRVLLHRFILGINDRNTWVLHRNHDALDNRRQNLVAVTPPHVRPKEPEASTPVAQDPKAEVANAPVAVTTGHDWHPKLTLEEPEAQPTCAVTACPNPVVRKRLCAEHWTSLRERKTPDTALWPVAAAVAIPAALVWWGVRCWRRR